MKPKEVSRHDFTQFQREEAHRHFAKFIYFVRFSSPHPFVIQIIFTKLTVGNPTLAWFRPVKLFGLAFVCLIHVVPVFPSLVPVVANLFVNISQKRD